jgi:hypothetical protein
MRKLSATAFKKGMTPHNKGARHQAKLRGDIHYFSGKPCKNGHIEGRFVKNGACVKCAKAKTKNHRNKETAEAKLIRLKKGAERAAKWRKENPNHKNTKIAKLEWSRSHPDQKYKDLAKRRAAKLKRTPSWMNDGHWFEVESIYKFCFAFRNLGFDWHVDHIIPLQGKNVSGLHAPWNLQVLSAKENLSKSNKFERT